MSPALTRRGLVQAGTAVLGTMVAPIAASAVPVPAVSPDSGLLALIARHPEVLRQCEQAEDEADRREGNARNAHPPQPEALHWRSTDFPRTSYGRAASDAIDDTDARRYFSRGVEWLRKIEPIAQWTEAAEARRREIVEAHDRWRAECREIDFRSGAVAAVQARCAAIATLRDVEREIQETEAHTLPGLRAKASWVAGLLADTGDDDLGEAFAREVASFGQVTS